MRRLRVLLPHFPDVLIAQVRTVFLLQHTTPRGAPPGAGGGGRPGPLAGERALHKEIPFIRRAARKFLKNKLGRWLNKRPCASKIQFKQMFKNWNLIEQVIS